MLIACDVDGVALDLHAEWYRRYNEEYSDDLCHERVLSWDVHKYVKPECGKKIYDLLQAPDLYDNIQPIPGAVDGIKRLREMGHTIMFATSCSYNMVDQKARCMERHGLCLPARPGFLPDDFIAISTKEFLAADLLIDDAAHVVRAWVEASRRALLVQYPHNAHLQEDVPSMFWQWCGRVDTWEQIVQYIALRSR